MKSSCECSSRLLGFFYNLNNLVNRKNFSFKLSTNCKRNIFLRFYAKLLFYINLIF